MPRQAWEGIQNEESLDIPIQCSPLAHIMGRLREATHSEETSEISNGRFEMDVREVAGVEKADPCPTKGRHWQVHSGATLNCLAKLLAKPKVSVFFNIKPQHRLQRHKTNNHLQVFRPRLARCVNLKVPALLAKPSLPSIITQFPASPSAMVVLSWLFGYAKPGVNNGDNKAPATTPISAPAVSQIPAPGPTPLVQAPHSIQPQTPADQQQQHQQPEDGNHFFSRRSLRQLGLFVGGAGFFYWSVLITRRAVTRHQIAAKLKFYHSNQWVGRSEKELPKKDPLVAVEALNLATLNTLTFAMMAGGGVSWAFDISSVEDLRRYTRRSILAAGGQADEEAEQEVANWVAKTFGIEEKKEATAAAVAAEEGKP